MHLNIGLDEKERFGSSELLERLLADEYILYTKTRNYHWNVTGPSFHELHLFFEKQYEILDEIIDQVAERIRALGFHSHGSLEQFKKLGRLPEGFGEVPVAQDMLRNLLTDHETVIRQLRKDVALTSDAYHDAGTSDFLTGLMEEHEKMAWMLRAYLI